LNLSQQSWVRSVARAQALGHDAFAASLQACWNTVSPQSCSRCSFSRPGQALAQDAGQRRLAGLERGPPDSQGHESNPFGRLNHRPLALLDAPHQSNSTSLSRLKSPTREFLSLIVAVAVIIVLGVVAVGGLLKIAETTF
jgi:hypothetical protein